MRNHKLIEVGYTTHCSCGPASLLHQLSAPSRDDSAYHKCLLALQHWFGPAEWSPRINTHEHAHSIHARMHAHTCTHNTHTLASKQVHEPGHMVVETFRCNSRMSERPVDGWAGGDVHWDGKLPTSFSEHFHFTFAWLWSKQHKH